MNRHWNRLLAAVSLTVLLAVPTVVLAHLPPSDTGTITGFLLDRNQFIGGFEWDCFGGSWDTQMMRGFEAEIYLHDNNGQVIRATLAQLAELKNAGLGLVATVKWIHNGSNRLLATRVDVGFMLP
jgi:hypothetical protein